MSNNEKIPVMGRDSSSEAATGKEKLDYPHFTTNSAPIQLPRAIDLLTRPASRKQQEYIGVLAHKVSKPVYQRIKGEVGISAEVTINRLSFAQASALIAALKAAGERRQ